MSDLVWITQVDHDKWGTVSNSLRSLMINEWMSDLLTVANLSHSRSFVSQSLICHTVAHLIWAKWANERMFYIRFFILKNKRFAHSLFFNEPCEQIAQVAHQKWAMWANGSDRSPKMSNHERFAQVAHQKWATMSNSLRLLTKNERMSESLVFLSESLIRSFFCKKRVFRSENWLANSQPCIFLAKCLTISSIWNTESSWYRILMKQ